MNRLTNSALLVAAVLSTLLPPSAAQDGTTRDMLFYNPATDLPDVLLSESVKYVTEGESFTYTVVLTHQPGGREDMTADLLNDEVRIYLTSSQEVYQQNGPDANDFQQVLGHRTQLAINTNTVYCNKQAAQGEWTDSSCTDGFCHAPFGHGYTDTQVATIEAITADQSTCEADTAGGAAGTPGVWVAASEHTTNPIPYYYVPYSTVNPAQASPIGDPGGTPFYTVVCPVCTHSKFCENVGSDIIDTTGVFNDDAGTTVDGGGAFDGCKDIRYKGFAPITDELATTNAAATGGYVTGGATAVPAMAADGSTTIEIVSTLTAGLSTISGLVVDSFDGVTGLITRSPMGPNLAVSAMVLPSLQSDRITVARLLASLHINHRRFWSSFSSVVICLF
eukprot:SAG11_NODE_14_length_26344_cov_14.209411_9_plen_392_part_00